MPVYGLSESGADSQNFHTIDASGPNKLNESGPQNSHTNMIETEESKEVTLK